MQTIPKIYPTTINEQTLKETAPLLTEGFPFRSACTDLRDYPGHVFPWHWHNEVEVLMIISGGLLFQTPTETLSLSEGDILFLTGGALHSCSCIGDAPAIHQEFIFSPLLIGGSPDSDISRKYVMPLLQADQETIVIEKAHPKHAELASLLSRVFTLNQEMPAAFELRIRHALEEFWLSMLEEASLPGKKRRSRTGDARIKLLLQYLQTHYQQNVTLTDLAAAASISERECSRCFQKQLGITAGEYLLSYRLNKAAELLLNTDTPVSEIAMNCGFSSASYFTKIFRERFHTTPREYRKR